MSAGASLRITGIYLPVIGRDKPQAGRTDICIRVEDRNAFNGECKFYNRPRSGTRAIDQLLGYVA